MWSSPRFRSGVNYAAGRWDRARGALLAGDRRGRNGSSASDLLSRRINTRYGRGAQLGLRSEPSPRRPAGGKRASLRVFTPGTCDGKRQAKGRRVNEPSGIIRRSRVTVGSKGCFFQDFIFLAFYVLVTDKKILESHGYFKKKISASYFIGD